MASKTKRAAARGGASSPNVRKPAPAPSRRGGLLILGGLAGLAIAIVAVALAVGGAFGAPAASPAVRDISVADLRAELQHKDFTLLNVKTPYIGEIDGTDLYIPYDQLQSRAGELPPDKNGKLVVYCRSGNESAIASRTLASLGYTHIENLTGGMQAWTAAGGTLVQKNR